MHSSVCLLRLCVLLSCISTTGARSAHGAGRGEHAAVVSSTKEAARPGLPGATAPTRRSPIYVGLIAAPSAFPGLGNEMARTVRSVLNEAGLDARLLTVGGAVASVRGETDSAMTGRIEEAGVGRLRLILQWRGHSAQALGDIEHLDDLAYAALETLRPRIVADAGSSGPAAGAAAQNVVQPPGPMVASASPEGTGPAAGASPTKAQTGSAAAEARKRPTARPGVVPASVSSPATPVAPAVAVAVATPGKDKTKPPETRQPARLDPPAVTPPATNPPPSPTSDPPPSPVVTERIIPRPRIAVHVVGEPLSSLPPAFLGAGTAAQQTILAYLQNRLRYPAVGSRLTGLVGGLDALTQSLRLGARHTLMARFDTLVDGFGPFGARTISGRLHIVLLLDGRPLLDRSLSIPPSTYYPTEPAAQVIARIVTAALDAISGELLARLGAPLPPAQ